MNGGGDRLGMRIIFGAIHAMGLSEEIKWQDFSENVEDTSANKAVKFLRSVFGSERPVLLLVDELGKAEDDKDVMKQLGEVSDFDGNTHVLVSSLSPGYIYDLVLEVSDLSST